MPIVLLVGGATGTGKSTVATEAAHRLGITRAHLDRLHPADDPRVLPAERDAVGARVELRGGRIRRARGGFLEQTRRVLVGVEASIERALTEGWSMVIEGVHLVPGLVPAEIDGRSSSTPSCASRDVDEHRSHFAVRDSRDAAASARSQKYLDGHRRRSASSRS